MSIVDFIFPKKCINCKKFGEFLCPNCFAKISYNQNFQCSICLKSSVDGMTHPGCMSPLSLDGAISVVIYNGVTKKLIYQFKYQPHLSKLAGTISELMNEGLSQNEGFYTYINRFKPVIVPIPLSSKRLRQRGYNHAELLGSYVAQYFKLKINSKILVRIKDTKPQYKLGRQARLANIHGAFQIARNSKLLENVILVDDIATSYTTLKEAAKVLKRAGVKRVLGITFAREAKT